MKNPYTIAVTVALVCLGFAGSCVHHIHLIENREVPQHEMIIDIDLMSIENPDAMIANLELGASMCIIASVISIIAMAAFGLIEGIVNAVGEGWCAIWRAIDGRKSANTREEDMRLNVTRAQHIHDYRNLSKGTSNEKQ